MEFLTRGELFDLLHSESPEDAIDEIYTPANNRLEFQPDIATEGDIIVFTVWSFRNLTLMDGIVGYLVSSFGRWAHLAPASLRRINAGEYADILEECIQRFTTAESADDPRWEADLFAYWKRVPDSGKPFDLIEKRFWARYNSDNDELTHLLFDFISDHREMFSQN